MPLHFQCIGMCDIIHLGGTFLFLYEILEYNFYCILSLFIYDKKIWS